MPTASTATAGFEDATMRQRGDVAWGKTACGYRTRQWGYRIRQWGYRIRQ